nr:helix-turn-helix domain-containing protein [Alkalicoccus chagannorensis]
MELYEIGKLYSIEEVAKMFNVETQTIRKWIKRGKLKALKLADTTLRVPQLELEILVQCASHHLREVTHANFNGRENYSCSK